MSSRQFPTKNAKQERIEKYVQINVFSGTWAESVIFKKHLELQNQGVESYVFWARGSHAQDKYMKKIATYPESCLDAAMTRLDGKACFHSKHMTSRLLKRLDEIDPDVVHLHVLLGYYINVEMLFNWVCDHHCHLLWTLHDCWAFTGHCIHFSDVHCDQWKRRCASDYPCPQTRTYPETLCNKNVGWNYDQKKRLFTMLPEDRFSLITPSQWLADLVAQSFLSKYPIKVVPNVVNPSIFKPTASSFRNRHNLHNRIIILGVSSSWSERKGLSDFLRLANDLDSSYVIVLIGLNAKQIRHLRKNGNGQLVLLPKTKTPYELAEAYTAANIFFNPTKEDNYPTVNLESESCGTPVVTYDVGGCRETLSLPESRCVSGYDEAVVSIEDLTQAAVSRNAKSENA